MIGGLSPDFSSGIAFKGEIVASVILDPYRNECFTATLGGGAFCNGEPIKVCIACDL